MSIRAIEVEVTNVLGQTDPEAEMSKRLIRPPLSLCLSLSVWVYLSEWVSR